MSKVAITLYDREYTVNCDPGEESRLQELVKYVESKMHKVVDKAGNATEARLFMLTCLMLADEVLDARRQADNILKKEEDLFVAAVEHLRDRVSHIASQIGRA